MEPPLLQESEQPQPCPPSAANSLRPIPSEGRRLVEPPLPSMDAVEEETMNVEQQVAPTDEHQTVQTTPEGEGCVQLPQISKKRLRKEEKANNLEEKRRKKQQEKRRKLEDKRRHNKEKEKKLQQKKNKDGTSPSAMHCSKEVRSPICRSPGVNMIRALKRRNSAALGKGSNKSSRSHILDETPEARANSLSPRSAAYQDAVPTTNLAAKPRKLRSKAWVDFDPIYEKGCIVSAKCKFCDEILPATHRFGRNGLVRHASSCSSRSQIHLMVDKLKTSISSPDASLVKQWDFDQGVSRRLLAEMIVLNELPFYIVEYSGFRKFTKSLNPAFHMVHRTTIRNDCTRLYNEHRSALREFFKQYKGRVSLTADLWTSNQKIGYICITCHYGSECKLQKRIIRFCRLETPHDGWSLYNVVLKSIQDWSIDDKLFGITLDNTSVNGAMVRYLKENELVRKMLPCSSDLLHFRCATHILNFIVQDGLDAMVGIIDNIRESVIFINNNPSRKERFDEICGRFGISGVARPSHDVPNRWNSSFLMLQSWVPFIKAFLALEKEDSKA